MRLTGMDRVLQQQERNRQHRQEMDEIVRQCQKGNYSLLWLLEKDYAVIEILHRNGVSKTDLEHWQLAAKEEQQGKPAEQRKLGVCCSCQKAYPVVPNPRPIEDGVLEGELFNWVMAPHMVYCNSGPWCEGKGAVPQSLVKD